MKEQLYKKVFIHSENDLPKESGVYECYFNDYTLGRATYDITDQYATTGKIWWINKVVWYLQVIEQSEVTTERQKLELKCNRDCNGPDCEGCKYAIKSQSKDKDILDFFIKELKEEFKDWNWDYLEFVKERVLENLKSQSLPKETVIEKLIVKNEDDKITLENPNAKESFRLSDGIETAIQDGLYATGRFTTDECEVLAEGLMMYINEYIKNK